MPFLEVRCLHVVELRPGEGNGTPLQYSCLENPMDGGASWAAVHGVAKSRTQLSDFTFTFHFPALEKEMATHSSVLAWRIPGTGEPGGLPSVGSQRVGVAESRTRLKQLSSSSSRALTQVCLILSVSVSNWVAYRKSQSRNIVIAFDKYCYIASKGSYWYKMPVYQFLNSILLNEYV